VFSLGAAVLALGCAQATQEMAPRASVPRRYLPPPAWPEPLPPETDPAAAAIAFAEAQLGKRYCWGGTGPNCFDCSGLVQSAWRAAGTRLPRTTNDQARALVSVPLGDVRPGDIFWWSHGHVGIYVGNVANTERYVADGVCERQGVGQMAQILARAEFEEMWAFVPRGCQWHEIGREEKSGNDRATLRVDMAYLETLMAGNDALHVYQIHPLRYFACASARCARGERWITDLVFSMPSASDVHFMMDVTSRFYRKRGAAGTIRHRVVTPYGVVDYGLTASGLAKYDAERNGRSEGLYITWVAASALDDERVRQLIEEGPASIVEGIRRLAQTLNTDFLRVEYLPGGDARP
jgi:hypothetical protein